MVPALTLWLPILVAAVLVFVASSVIHMALKYHKTDFSPLPNESEILGALRPHAIPQGEYYFPFAADGGAMRSEEWQQNVADGPVGFMTVLPNAPPNMARNLGLWFVYCLVVGLFTAYLTGLAYGPGADYMEIFRFAGTAAFACYVLAMWQDAIWFGSSWRNVLKSSFDGLVYGLLTAGAFGWLWPG